MTKKTIITVILTLGMFASSAHAADQKTKKKEKTPATAASKEHKKWSRPYGMAGCGLGHFVVGKKGGQIFAATTNNTSANQYFGITFGTLDCEDDPNDDVAQNVDKFISANKVALASDMSRGGGETLAALSTLMECDTDSATFGTTMQKNFKVIYPDEKIEPNEVTDSIITVIMNDTSLSGHCNVII